MAPLSRRMVNTHTSTDSVVNAANPIHLLLKNTRFTLNDAPRREFGRNSGVKAAIFLDTRRTTQTAQDSDSLHLCRSRCSVALPSKRAGSWDSVRKMNLAVAALLKQRQWIHSRLQRKTAPLTAEPMGFEDPANHLDRLTPLLTVAQRLSALPNRRQQIPPRQNL